MNKVFTTTKLNSHAKLQPLTSVKVGDKVRLLPNEQVRYNNHEYRLHPNNTLGIPFDTVLTVEAVEIAEGVALIRVRDSFKTLNMKRFAKA